MKYKYTVFRYGDGSRWGVWNRLRRRWEFDIDVETPYEACKALVARVGRKALRWRYRIRRRP